MNLLRAAPVYKGILSLVHRRYHTMKQMRRKGFAAAKKFINMKKVLEKYPDRVYYVSVKIPAWGILGGYDRRKGAMEDGTI